MGNGRGRGGSSVIQAADLKEELLPVWAGYRWGCVGDAAFRALLLRSAHYQAFLTAFFLPSFWLNPCWTRGAPSTC